MTLAAAYVPLGDALKAVRPVEQGGRNVTRAACPVPFARHCA